jgi:5-methyltetrahydrofolate corrinoid/iron sulfur protein methyltransferase
MAKFITIGERIHCIAPEIKKAIEEKDPAPILKRAKDQVAAGATYIDVNIGPAEDNGEEIMQWAVQIIQEECDNVPLALDTANQKAIEAGIKVYNRSKGKPIVNSADAGDRIEYIDLAAANDAIVIALCSKGVVAADNDERMAFLQEMLERGLEHGMEAEDLWFDPLFLVTKGMQEKQMEIIEAIRQTTEMGLNTTGGLSNNSNGMPKSVRPLFDSTMLAMCIANGFSSAIVNPNDKQLMDVIKATDVIKNEVIYADSLFE